jgi:hypothetical protein
VKVLVLTFDDLRRPGPRADHVKALAGSLGARVAAAPHRFERLAAAASFFLKEARAAQPDVLLLRGLHVSVAPALVAERLGLPLVVEIDGLLEDQVKGSARRKVIRAVHRFTLARAARVVASSPAVKALLAERYGFERVDVGDVGASLRKALA